MKLPDQIREVLVRRYRTRRRLWMRGGGRWPLTLGLGCPSELEAQGDLSAVRAWVAAWRSWSGAGEVLWETRRWRSLGTQEVPIRLTLRSPDDIAAWAGEAASSKRVAEGYELLARRWPVLRGVLASHADFLEKSDENDIQRVASILEWFREHPDSGLYPRQLPIPGMDTKWIEARSGIITSLFSAIQGRVGSDFYEICGLRRPPFLIRMRILDSRLREQVGGLGDFAGLPSEIARLDFAGCRAFIVENLQTALAFRDLPGAVVFMALGYGIDILDQIPWLKQAQVFYWGDIDTHGLAILSRLRAYFPKAESLLMTKEILLSHLALKTVEKEPHPATDLLLLTPTEQAVYEGLKEDRWGSRLRLEQERISWEVAWVEIERAAGQRKRPGQ